MEVLNIFEKIKIRCQALNTKSSNKIIAIKRFSPNDIEKLDEVFHDKIYIANMKSDTVKTITNNKKMFNIYYLDNTNYIFYVSYDIRKEKCFLQFNKMNLVNEISNIVGEIEINQKILLNKYWSFNFVLKAIDERYVVYFFNSDDSSSFKYNKFLLIDSIEKKVYNLEDFEGVEKHLYRSTFPAFDVLSTNIYNYIVLKTGGITNYEKYTMHRNGRVQICDEELIIYKLNKLPNNSREKISLSKRFVEECSDNKSLEIIDKNNHIVIYLVQQFNNKKSSIIQYDILNDRKRILSEDNFLYKYEYYVYNHKDNIVYGINRNENKIHVSNIITKTEKSYQHDGCLPIVQFCDEDILVIEDIYYDTLIYNNENRGIIHRYKNRKPYYYQDSDLLLLC